MTIKYFEDLVIWQEARKLCQAIYQITKIDDFSKDIRFCSQIKAAAGSIMDNIAEGFEREGRKEFVQFLYVAKGSCGEVRSQLHRAADAGYINQDQYNSLILQTRNLNVTINNFIKYLRQTEIEGQRYNSQK